MPRGPQGWWKCRLSRALTADEAADLKALAGPIYQPWARSIVFHENVGWLLEQHLASTLAPAGVRVVHVQRPPARAPRPAQLPAVPELREWVPSFLAPYQRDGVLTHSESNGVLCVLGTGAGKSLFGIVWGLFRPGLIVIVTRAGARRTLAGEVRKYTCCEPLILEGTKPVAIPSGTRFVVVAWESLKHHVKSLVAANPTTAIFDESHLASSHRRFMAVVARNDAKGESQRDEAGDERIEFKSRENRAAATQVLANAVERAMDLTATPVRDRLRNLWAQLDIILPRAFGSFYDFCRRYCDAHEGKFGGIDTSGRGPPERMEELQKRLSFVTYYVPQSVTHRDLPPLRRQVTYVPPEELSTGRDVLRELREHRYSGATGEAWAKLALAAAMKRKRVVEEAVAGAYATPDGRGGGKVVVFTGLRTDCERIAAGIEAAVTKRNGKGEYVPSSRGVTVFCGHGGHDPRLRDKMREDYMAHPGPCTLVGTGDAWGESLNLQDTDLYIDAMLPWSPGQIRQREGRFKRHGMTRPVLALYLIAEGTKDEEVALALLNKLPAVEVVAQDEVLVEFATDLRGDENAIVAGLLAKLTSSDGEETEEEMEA